MNPALLAGMSPELQAALGKLQAVSAGANLPAAAAMPMAQAMSAVPAPAPAPAVDQQAQLVQTIFTGMGTFGQAIASALPPAEVEMFHNYLKNGAPGLMTMVQGGVFNDHFQLMWETIKENVK